MVEIKGVVFDIDDTLYLERDYVHSGFKAIAELIGNKSGPAQKREEVFEFLWSAFESGISGNTFDLLFQTFPTLMDQFSVQDLVRAYREHIPSIEIDPEMRKLIEHIKSKDIRLGVISDGPLNAQKNKTLSLGLEELFDEIALTDLWGREFWKPHHRAFEYIELRFGLLPEHLLYIADNPKKDFIAPNQRGWKSIHLVAPGQLTVDKNSEKQEAEAQYVVYSIGELTEILLTTV